MEIALGIRELISGKIYVLEGNCEFQKHIPVWVCSHEMHTRDT